MELGSGVQWTAVIEYRPLFLPGSLVERRMAALAILFLIWRGEWKYSSDWLGLIRSDLWIIWNWVRFVMLRMGKIWNGGKNNWTGRLDVE